MYYISSYNINKNLLGVTDSIDNAEEFYTKDMLGDIFKKHRIKIIGLIYTGSYFKYEIKNSAIISLESMLNGNTFYLNDEPVMLTGASDLKNFNIFNGTKTIKITQKDLLKGKYNLKGIDTGVSETERKVLVENYLKSYPTSQLSLFLSV